MADTNCPNCGAPIDGDRCEYCGTVVFDMACMDLDNPFWLKVKFGGGVSMFRCVLESFDVDNRVDTFYADSVQFMALQQPETKLVMELRVVPNRRGVTKVFADGGKVVNADDLRGVVYD